MQESLIPLFPLEVVLFPGQPLPLHIFEERYKIMIRECLATEGPREFGVVLAKPDGIANVGCTAEVVEVVRSYADGRMDIVAAGKRRFEVLFVDENKEYLRAAAQFFHDEESPAPDALRDHVVEIHRQLGSVNTNGHNHVTMRRWNSRKLNTNGSRHTCRCSAATSAFRTSRCSTPSCMSPSMAANGAGYPHGLATGTPSTPA